MVAKAEDPVDAIAQLVKNIVFFCHNTDSRAWVEIYTEASRDQDIRAICDETEEPVRKTLALAIQKGKNKGLITSKHDVATLVDIVMASCWGSISKLSYKPDTPLETEMRLAYSSVRTLLLYS